mgnify:CR=1 FL=1
MKKYILMFVSSMMLVSCLDTIILPDDKTVDEDFWQTKADVSSMVNAAYAALASDNVLARYIIWGGFRSDELVLTTNKPTASANLSVYEDLEEMAAVNMQTTNTFGDWSPIYAAINRCNIVLERAEGVMSVDPNYTEGDYKSDRSQMLALRALCYFYLVRNYRDVPYITQAYMTSSQNMQVGQSTPSYVIDQCIADLEEAAKAPMKASGFTSSDWQRVGWMLDDGINALLADIYLWRASVTHNAADYQRCIDYCNTVIASKKAQHVPGRSEVVVKDYPLADYKDNANNEPYTALFGSQNAEESIFELQDRSNLAVCQYFHKHTNNQSGSGYVKASSFFGNAASKVQNVQSVQCFSNNDLRYYTSIYSPTDDGDHDVRKMIAQSGLTSKTSTKRESTLQYGAKNQNYIIYRLSDVMLMKAEALVQQAEAVDETASQEEKDRVAAANEGVLHDAFRLVQYVNTRSLHADNLADSMMWNDKTAHYNNYDKSQMEQLVLAERLRELCFEGKRWYDLLRYNYRHIDYDAAKYDQLLVDLNESNALGEIDADMKTMMTRSRGTDATAVSAKMQNEAYLYLPVPNRDIIVCPLLKQNPAYKGGNEFEKQY